MLPLLLNIDLPSLGSSIEASTFVMNDATCHIGQRLSLQSHTGTLRYYGKVEGKTGEWLGIEWDDPTRGKNDGVHNGIRYFTCMSTYRGMMQLLIRQVEGSHPLLHLL